MCFGSWPMGTRHMAKSFESRNKDLSTRLQKARKFWVSHKRCMVFGYKNVHGSPIRSWLPKSRTWGVQCHSNQESRACMSLIKTPMYRFYFAKIKQYIYKSHCFKIHFHTYTKGPKTNTKIVYNMCTNFWKCKNMALLFFIISNHGF